MQKIVRNWDKSFNATWDENVRTQPHLRFRRDFGEGEQHTETRNELGSDSKKKKNIENGVNGKNE